MRDINEIKQIINGYDTYRLSSVLVDASPCSPQYSLDGSSSPSPSPSPSELSESELSESESDSPLSLSTSVTSSWALAYSANGPESITLSFGS